MKTIRIGVVGAGANTRERHLPGFQALPGVEVVTVANRTRASAERVAVAFGIGRVAEDWREVVADPEVDAVCIGTWPYLHAEVAIAALKAGKHVLTEARMARNAEEAAMMVAASKARPGLVAQVVPSPFTLAYDATIRGWMEAGEWGRWKEIVVTHHQGGHADPSTRLTWRQHSEWSGHNVLTLGIHYEAVRRWVEEDAEVEAAEGEVLTPVRKDETGADYRVVIPERLRVEGRFPRCGAKLRMDLSGVEKEARHEIRVETERGTFRLDLGAGGFWRAGEEGEEHAVEVDPWKRGAWRVEADFVDSIRTGMPVRLTDFETGRQTMRFTDEVWALAVGRDAGGG